MIDINLTSSIDIQTNMTDYVDLLVEFANECALNSNYTHTKSHSDPITSQINFFKDLNDNSIKLKDNKDGVKKRNVTGKQLINKNYRDQLPPEKHLKTKSGNKYGEPKTIGSNKVETYTTNTKRTWVAKDGDPENSQSVGEWKMEETTKDSKHDVAPLLNVQKSPPEIESTFGMEKMNSWFKMWWIEKFRTSHQIIRDNLKDLLGSNNEYFVNFSESIGQLKNLTDTYNTSTLPVWDTEVNAYGKDYSIPQTTPSIGGYGMQPEQHAYCDQLSLHTNKIFRENISGMMEDASKDALTTSVMPSFTIMSHGNNLTSDDRHAARMTGCIEVVHDALRDHLKGLYDVLELLSNKENYMMTGKPKQIQMKVERFTCSVDLLKNRIKSYNLTENDVTTTRYGKRSSYIDNRSNADRLANAGVKE